MHTDAANIDNQKISFEISGPEEEAAKLVMEWRNDPETRRQSFHGELKSWPDFFSEYKNDYLADPALPPLFALLGGRKVGFLRFRRTAHPIRRELATCDISINLAPVYRGRGLGRLIIKSVLPVVKSWGVDSILAEVKIDNAISVSMFEAAGFRLFDETDREVVDLGIRVRVKQMLFDLVDAIPV